MLIGLLVRRLPSSDWIESYGTVLSAINFGYDTDTDAAVTGALAGAFYGMDSIPDRWLRAIKKKETMETYTNDFAQCLVE